MELKQIEGKNLIYDGLEDSYYNEHTFKLNNGDEIKFSPLNILKLKELQKIEEVLYSCPNIRKSSITHELSSYKNEDNLSVSFKETDKYIIIISLGELQPGRYRISIEKVFSKSV